MGVKQGQYKTHVYSISEKNYRASAKRRGYILGDFTDGSGEQKTIFWDWDTNRSRVFERHLSNAGFKVRELLMY